MFRTESWSVFGGRSRQSTKGKAHEGVESKTKNTTYYHISPCQTSHLIIKTIPLTYMMNIDIKSMKNICGKKDKKQN